MLGLLGGRRGHRVLEDVLEGRAGKVIKGREGVHLDSGEMGEARMDKGIVPSLGRTEKTHVNR